MCENDRFRKETQNSEASESVAGGCGDQGGGGDGGEDEDGEPEERRARLMNVPGHNGAMTLVLIFGGENGKQKKAQVGQVTVQQMLSCEKKKERVLAKSDNVDLKFGF